MISVFFATNNSSEGKGQYVVFKEIIFKSDRDTNIIVDLLLCNSSFE